MPELLVVMKLYEPAKHENKMVMPEKISSFFYEVDKSGAQ
jgi:hypothetical protein